MAHLTPPSPDALVNLFPDEAPRVLLTLDTEEGFDWRAPFSRTDFNLDAVPQLERFQAFCEEIGAHPVYMVDWPIAWDERAVAIISEALARGRADLGIQLHPWVNPPFDEPLSPANSFAGNLDPALEKAKFHLLFDRIVEAFGARPQIYRAGRYGAGPNTAAMLKHAGIKLDSSVRPLLDYTAQGGPNFMRHPQGPYWLDKDKSLLELPLTTILRGSLQNQQGLFHMAERRTPYMLGLFAKLNLLERIPLTPEGTTPSEALRALDAASTLGLPLLVISLHSSSLAPGGSPYARDETQVEAIYGWLGTVYAEFERRGIASATIEQILTATLRAVSSDEQKFHP